MHRQQMGLPDIPPPTTSCLKRCRSEDPSSLAELCSPLLKQPFTHSSHHLSILEDLESSLNAVPTIEAAPTPEELVTEMMQSLEKVMGDIGELIAGSTSDSYTCGKLCDGNLQDFPAYGETSPSIGAVSPHASEALNLCRDTAADCEESAVACDMGMPNFVDIVDGCRGMASDCDIGSAVGACRSDVSNGDFAMVAHVSEEGCIRDGCIGSDSIQHLLDTSDDEFGLTHGTMPMPTTDQTGEQWSLVDDLADGFALSAFPSNQINWLEEECDLPAFTLSQIEEEELLPVARESTDLLLLDCYF